MTKILVTLRIEPEILKEVKKRVTKLNRKHSGITVSSYLNDIIKKGLERSDNAHI